MRLRSIALVAVALAIGCGSDRVRAVGTEDTIPGPARLTSDRATVDFGETGLGDLSEQTVRITNAGERPATALKTTLSGADATGFSITSDGCSGASLAPRATCEVRAALRPEEERRFAAALQVSSDGSSAEVGLAGTGRNEVRLTISDSARSFGGVDLNGTAAAAVRVTNAGRRASHRLALAAEGDVSSFLLAGDCAGRALRPGEACELRVIFGPQRLGAHSLAVTVTGSPLEQVRARFDGYGKRLAHLTVETQGDGQVSLAPPAPPCEGKRCTLTVEVGGPVTATALLVALPGSRALFDGWSGDCAGTSPSCSLTMDQDRTVVAKFARVATVTIKAAVLAKGEGRIQLADGRGCTAPCTLSATVRAGTRLGVTATPGAESQHRWLGACGGTDACELSPEADAEATAVFNGANYLFFTSQMYPANLGVPGYDAACNERAGAAGLPGPYLAWMSTTSAAAASRLSEARGFIRVDGRPVADTLAPGAPIYFPPALDESGNPPPDPLHAGVLTGSTAMGQLAVGNNCADWSTTVGHTLWIGDALGGTGAFSSFYSTGCDTTWSLLCVGSALRKPLQLERAQGRIAFTSTALFQPKAGLPAADQICRDEARAAALPGSYQALLASEGSSAVSRFDLSGPPWVRTDGVPIAAAATELAAGRVLAAAGVSATGVHFDYYAMAWSGAATPGTVGTAESTCASWSTDGPVLGSVGEVQSANPFFFFGVKNWCSQSLHLYCLQE